MIDTVVGRRLAAELRDLDDLQRRAVRHQGNVALTAGPGSGKTRTLVARAAYLTESNVSPFRRVGLITYAKAAAQEITGRLTHFGREVSERTTSRTFHSFCLNEILRPYSTFVGDTSPRRENILPESSPTASRLRQECYDEAVIPELEPDKRISQLCAIRRALVCGEDTSGFDEREVHAARLFERRLLDLGMIDYEAMVSRALHVVRRSEQARDLFQARFPHLLVDEYQDLGGVLHAVVETLRKEAGVQVFAVGDIDQSLYAFTGAHPKYLNELVHSPAYEPIQLQVNYRSSPSLLPLFSAALGIQRDRIGVQGGPLGKYSLHEAPHGLESHATTVISEVRRLLSEGISPDRIAILYPGRGRLLNALLNGLSSSGLEYQHVRDEDLPSGDVFAFIRSCAIRLNRLHQNPLAVRDADPSLEKLEIQYRVLREQSPLQKVDRRVVLRALLIGIDEIGIRGTAGNDFSQISASDWLEQLGELLELVQLQEGEDDDDREAKWTEILDYTDGLGSLASLVSQLDATGKVVLTTYHSAKGLGFDTVILPGLVDGVIPSDARVNGVWGPPAGDRLEEGRRAFYVAVTRAERELVFVYGHGYQVTPTFYKRSQPSIFLREMGARLDALEEE